MQCGPRRNTGSATKHDATSAGSCLRALGCFERTRCTPLFGQYLKFTTANSSSLRPEHLDPCYFQNPQLWTIPLWYSPCKSTSYHSVRQLLRASSEASNKTQNSPCSQKIKVGQHPPPLQGRCGGILCVGCLAAEANGLGFIAEAFPAVRLAGTPWIVRHHAKKDRHQDPHSLAAPTRS